MAGKIDVLLSEPRSDFVPRVLGTQNEMRQRRAIELEADDRLIGCMAVFAAAGGVAVVKHRNLEFVSRPTEQIPQLLGMALREEMELLETLQEIWIAQGEELEPEVARRRRELLGPLLLRLMRGISDQADDDQGDNDEEQGDKEEHRLHLVRRDPGLGNIVLNPNCRVQPVNEMAGVAT